MIDFRQARHAMVDTQVRPSDVTRYAIIEAMLEIPRELFVPKALRDVAYAESDIRMGEGRTLLPPRTFAKMLEAARVGPDDMVLDIAPGLGYSTAVFSRLAAAVLAVEPDEALSAHAAETLSDLECDNAIVTTGAAVAGDPAHGPYDVIFVNGGVEVLPPSLTDQLKEGGRLVAIHMSGAVGQCRVSLRSGDTVTSRPIFDATAPVLEGFGKVESFVF